MSCPEVVYQAYYPYLYQRPPGAANSSRAASFPHFPHQYDRFNVQRSLEQPSSDTYHPHSSHHSSAGSVSSGGGVGSPESPPPRHSSSKDDTAPNTSTERHSSRNLAGASGADDDDDEDEVTSPGGSRAQYVSANCVVFTHYSGDVESVVDEHFSRALSCTSGTTSSASASAESSKTSTSKTKESSPLTSRNLPASFWNSNYQGASSVTAHPGEFYAESSMYHSPSAAATDPWHTHYQQYTAAAHHHRAVHEYHHHHNMAAQYSSLLLPPTSRLPHQYHHSKPGVEPWTSGHTHHRLHHDQTSSIDPTATYTTYSTMAGLEAQVQESSKDLYWF